MVVGTSSIRNHFGGATPFKVHVNFDIPLFEGKINVYSLEKWLNLLEGYSSIQKFLDIKKITVLLLKALPHIKYWWDCYWERHGRDESTTFRT
jgi:hypothetical protein